MKHLCEFASAIVVALYISVSSAASPVTAAGNVPKVSGTISVQSKLNSANIPTSKTNWSKIKDLFL